MTMLHHHNHSHYMRLSLSCNQNHLNKIQACYNNDMTPRALLHGFFQTSPGMTRQASEKNRQAADVVHGA